MSGFKVKFDSMMGIVTGFDECSLILRSSEQVIEDISSSLAISGKSITNIIDNLNTIHIQIIENGKELKELSSGLSQIIMQYSMTESRVCNNLGEKNGDYRDIGIDSAITAVEAEVGIEVSDSFLNDFKANVVENFAVAVASRTGLPVLGIALQGFFVGKDFNELLMQEENIQDAVVKTVAHLAIGMVAGKIGAKLGTAIGAAIGTLFSGEGAIIAAPVGEICGDVLVGACLSTAGNMLFDAWYDDNKEEIYDSVSNVVHIVRTPEFGIGNALCFNGCSWGSAIA